MMHGWFLTIRRSSQYILVTYEIIHIIESTTKHSRFENTESNITVIDWEVFSYFSRDDLFKNHNFKTNTRLWNNNNARENWQ